MARCSNNGQTCFAYLIFSVSLIGLFASISCADPMIVANRQQYAGNEDISEISESAPGERLVRVPLDELQTDTMKS